MTAALRVHENGAPIDFSYATILDYHGRSAPAGVAHAVKVMQRAFPLLDPTAPLERREIVIATAFAGPGARDAFEAVTLQLRPGHVSEEFIDLARAGNRTATQDDRLHGLKLEMSERLRGLDAVEVYELVPD